MTVRVNVPTWPPRCVATVNIDVAIPLGGRDTGLGLNDALDLLGSPVTERFTFPVNPPSEVSVTV